MIKAFFYQILLLLLSCGAIKGHLNGQEVLEKTENEKHISIYVIPIEGEISSAHLYILRRGLKQAVQHGIDAIILKINTPGGDLATTLQIMEALENFKGETMTFVDTEAISAGAYIAASTDEIYFHPKSLLGAAAVIQSGGTEVPATLKQKIESYLRAKIRSHTAKYRYRAEVIRAMMDLDFVFKIDDKVIKEKGELLTVTAQEAMEMYGDPPQALLGAGIVEDVEALLKKQYGDTPYSIKRFELTWSEYLARWMNKITPILLGIGMLCIFIEFKTPGFGFFGICGILLLLIVFASSYIAGLAGHEGIIVFCIGLLLIGLELFIIPGIFVAGAIGILMVLGSIVWALADIWPGQEFQITPELFVQPLIDLAIGLIIACIGVVIVGRFLLGSWIWDLLILRTSVGAQSTVIKKDEEREVQVTDEGIAVTDLHPWGEVEIRGKRYPARVGVEVVNKDAAVEVIGKEDFGLIVKSIKK